MCKWVKSQTLARYDIITAKSNNIISGRIYHYKYYYLITRRTTKLLVLRTSPGVGFRSSSFFGVPTYLPTSHYMQYISRHVSNLSFERILIILPEHILYSYWIILFKCTYKILYWIVISWWIMLNNNALLAVHTSQISYITFRHVLLNSSVPNNRKKEPMPKNHYFFYFFFFIVLYNALASIVFHGTTKVTQNPAALYAIKYYCFIIWSHDINIVIILV